MYTIHFSNAFFDRPYGPSRFVVPVVRQVIFSIYYRMLFFDMSQICSFILGNEGAGSDILEHEFIDLRVPVVPGGSKNKGWKDSRKNNGWKDLVGLWDGRAGGSVL